MRADQHIDFIKKGLLMTLFTTDENLLRNFSLFFGDGNVEIHGKENLSDGNVEFIITAKAKPEVCANYDRAFVVLAKEIDNVQHYKYQIVAINEC